MKFWMWINHIFLKSSYDRTMNKSKKKKKKKKYARYFYSHNLLGSKKEKKISYIVNLKQLT